MNEGVKKLNIFLLLESKICIRFISNIINMRYCFFRLMKEVVLGFIVVENNNLLLF